jgi:hypothetical protein
MFKQGNKFHTSDINSDVLKPYENEEVKILLSLTYGNFEAAYIPDKYDIAFILMKENHEDSSLDQWKISFFKKILKMPELSKGTITLDNLDDLQSSGYVYQVYKELDASYEDVIKISCDIISKHRSGYEKEVLTNLS